MPDNRTAWDAANTVQLKLKLNKRTDEDILLWLEAQPNKQGAIKALIRNQIKECSKEEGR